MIQHGQLSAVQPDINTKTLLYKAPTGTIGTLLLSIANESIDEAQIKMFIKSGLDEVICLSNIVEGGGALVPPSFWLGSDEELHIESDISGVTFTITGQLKTRDGILSTPYIMSPVNGFIYDVDTSATFISSDFSVISGMSEHLVTDWEIRQNGSILIANYNDGVNLTDWTVDLTGLPINTNLTVRVRYKGTNNTISGWSETIIVVIGNAVVQTPAIEYPEDGERLDFYTDIITVEASTFIMQAGVDSHFRSSWELIEGGSIVASSYNDESNLTSWTVDISGITRNVDIAVRVRYVSINGVLSEWSEPIVFSREDLVLEQPTIIEPTEGEILYV